MANPSVAIIGAGIMGAARAYALSKRIGSAVTVIDRSNPGGGTTATTMAWLNASNKTPREYFDLNFAGLRENYAVADELVDHSWINASGSLVSEDYHPGLAERIDRLAEWGYQVERLDARTAVEQYDPQLSLANPDELFARYPEEGWVDGQIAVRVLLDAAIANGAVLRTGAAVTSISRNPEGGFTIGLEDESEIVVDIVVNAAGGVADKVASLVGREITLAGTDGLVLRLAGPVGLVNSMVLTKTIDVRSDGEGFYRIHSDEVDDKLNAKRASRDELVAELLERARTIVPGLAEATVVRQYSSVRPMPEDHYSSLGAVTAIPGYYEMITHSGITFGPLFGRIISELILDGASTPIVDPMFSPDRF